MKIACLYICTGEYMVFWREFYESFEKYFLPEMEKEYFVFTDAATLEGQESGKVHLYHVEWQPWPIPTLLKYHTFLMVEEELRKFDYIYQPNSNARCREEIMREDFLPRKEFGEKLFFTEHPAQWYVDNYIYPYYRNPQSYAYVPYSQKTVGVFGAMNGGEADAFISLMKEMAHRTSLDLKQCIIPIHHDESYINNYIVRHLGDSTIRFLPSDYAYPQEYNIPCGKKIELVNKNNYFNASDVKYIMPEWKKRTIYDKMRDRVIKYTHKMYITCKVLNDKLHHKKAK